jgi:outer membrane protein assembly factor BamB
VRGKTKLWSFATGNLVRSSPAVVYIGSWDDNVYALNASTGAKLWSFATANVVESSPAVANGVIYVSSDPTSNGGGTLFVRTTMSPPSMCEDLTA